MVCVRVQQISLRTTIHPISCTAHTHHAIRHRNTHPISHGLRQLTNFAPLCLGVMVGVRQFVNVGIKALCAPFCSRHIRKVTSTRHNQVLVNAPRKRSRHSLLPIHLQRRKRAIAHRVKRIVVSMFRRRWILRTKHPSNTPQQQCAEHIFKGYFHGKKIFKY